MATPMAPPPQMTIRLSLFMSVKPEPPLEAAPPVQYVAEKFRGERT
jgi:hypothetical protein